MSKTKQTDKSMNIRLIHLGAYPVLIGENTGSKQI